MLIYIHVYLSAVTAVKAAHAVVTIDHSITQLSLVLQSTVNVTIWMLGRTVCVYSMVQRKEKEKDSRYMDETSAPAAVTVYQICNISPAQVYL